MHFLDFLYCANSTHQSTSGTRNCICNPTYYSFFIRHINHSLTVGVRGFYYFSRCRGTREPPSLMWLKDRHTNKHCTVYLFQRVNTRSNVARN
ncbi:hypothetical protein ACJ76_04115 [Escherichia coli]|nr:hypothetical protein ACJ76_04115 [Escherichia coli]KQI74612.1 hypothetical protein AM258_19410 [Escherichia coli]